MNSVEKYIPILVIENCLPRSDQVPKQSEVLNFKLQEFAFEVQPYRSLQSSENRKNKVTVAHTGLAEQFQSWFGLGIKKS